MAVTFAPKAEARSDPFRLHGQTALITGGAQGIGFGIARRLMEAGANVVLADVDIKAEDEALRSLNDGTFRGRAVAVTTDVSDVDACTAAVSECVSQFGGLDILVNDAGIFPNQPVLKATPELFDRVLGVNLRGLVFMSKAAGLQMVQQGHGGKIVNIASIDSLHPSMVGLAAYDASKGGVLMFTKSFALEMAPHHVNVNAIAPGGITTEGTSVPMSGMTAQQTHQMKKAFEARIPLGRMGLPDDIAKVALFLASPAADYMTGALVVVDGGMLLA